MGVKRVLQTLKPLLEVLVGALRLLAAKLEGGIYARRL